MLVLIVIMLLGLGGVAVMIILNKRKMAGADGYDKVQINEESPISQHDFSWGNAGGGEIVKKGESSGADDQFQVSERVTQ